MSETWADWSEIVLCGQCGRANPSDIFACLNCGQQIRAGRETDPAQLRPYARPNTTLPFFAQRTTEEVNRALEIIQEEDIFSWVSDGNPPSELTAAMIADAENTIRLRLPSSLLAILKMQNGGESYKNRFHEEYVPMPVLNGIAPGHSTYRSLQEMPQAIWEAFEAYYDEDFYSEWWGTFDGEIHPDWSSRPRIPETILLIGEEGHWGIGLNYVRCGRQGEPSVVHVEMEGPVGAEEFLTELAPDFMTFLRGLYHEE